MQPIGKPRWAIGEGYIRPASTGTGRALESHETACILNAGDDDAHAQIAIFFHDREPLPPRRVTVPARRTLHLRFNKSASRHAPTTRASSSLAMVWEGIPALMVRPCG